MVCLRDFVDLAEGKTKHVPAPWGWNMSSICDPSIELLQKQYPTLKKDVSDFIARKIVDPLQIRYGAYDYPFTGPLKGASHCHLRDDALLIYTLKGRSINCIMVVRHAQIEGPRLKIIAKAIKPYL